ncbi:hypothetical protein QAD02_022587 [Eretmocerus hayati]|uniref:Uncharacterized protein n=1 Tax=Eretmocerus hayati TaxID=131215 RepID=A0ACC2PUJ2_9HYME|nr:hypothetical protein QAD02_022587 [Eretmocerus hayati]
MHSMIMNIRIIYTFIMLPIMAKGFDDQDTYIFEYNYPKNCRSNEYFDADSFSCVECDATKNLEPSENGVACVCNKYSRKVGFERDLPKCEQCPPGTVLTRDKKSCISCGKLANSTCKCGPNEVQIERDLDGDLLESIKCIQCSESSYPSSDNSKCLACHNASSSHTSCACPITTHVRIQDHCFRKNDLDLLDVRNTYLVEFENESIDSYYFRKELRLSVYLCKDGDKTACERLSNMCALSLSEKSVACKVSKSKQDPNSFSWMFYESGGYPVVTNKKIIPVNYTLDKNHTNNRLNFSVVTFSLDGEFKYIDTPNLFCTFLNNVRFGVNVHKQCKIHAKELTTREMNFFVPYLMYNDEKQKSYLSSVPVFGKSRAWQPMKKFFIIDSISSYKALPNLVDDTFRKEEELSMLRYMKSLEISIKVQNDRDGGHIYTPLMAIEYGEINKQDLQDNKPIIVDYKVTFILTYRHRSTYMEIAIGILSAFAGAYSALKTWSYCKRDFNGVLSIGVVIWLIIYGFGAFGNVLLLVTTTVCIYTFTFYKGQTVLHILLPSHGVETRVYRYIILAFCCKIIEMLALIYHHRSINVFLLDWEQPRIVQNPTHYDSPHTSLNKLYNNRFDQDNAIKTPKSSKSKRGTDESSQEDSPRNNNTSIVEKHAEMQILAEEGGTNTVQHSPVSIWRTYFVANEWFKIQAKRRVNIVIQICLTIFILEIVGLKHWAQTSPELKPDESESYSVNEKNFTLRFGVGALIYVTCYCIQWIISVTIYERYVQNRLQHFVDLCSVANISVFIFAYDYYAHYIHGRSVHGYADTDLETLTSDLKKEENNLCAHRGLLPGTTNQTFTASLSASFHGIYSKLLDQQNVDQTRFTRRNILESANWEKSLQTHLKMKKFLSAFVDHCFKDLDYTVKERLLVEKLCDIEMGKTDDQSVFYIDNSNSFDKVIFYGNEWTFGTFEYSLFIFVHAISANYILACMITLLISQLLLLIGRVNGKRNLSNKTLIDERFLT